MKCFIFLTLFVSYALPQFIEYQRTPLGDSVDKASMKILKESFRNGRDKNIIASPLGALTLLSMFSAGTDGRTKKEIMKLLNSTDYKQIEESYGALMERFSTMDPSYFVLANKIYISDTYTIDDQFSNIASQKYKSEIELVNFEQKNITVDRINQWANNKTKGNIKTPVNEDTIDSNAAMALFNVIFFQGHWHVPFDATVTEEKKFYVNKSKTIKKPMMKLQQSLYYCEDAEIGARMVELPYKERGFRMVVILPDKKDGLGEMVKKIALKGILQNVFALEPAGREIALEMPKFEIKSGLDLNVILPKVGVSRIFSSGARGIVRKQAVTVSKAFQEAFVKVDEEGASAGAFTGFVLEPRSSISESPPPLEFKR